MMRLEKALPIPGTFFKIKVSAVFSSTRVPFGYFSVEQHL